MNIISGPSRWATSILMPDYILQKVLNVNAKITSVCVDKYNNVLTCTGGSMIKHYFSKGESTYTQLGCYFTYMAYNSDDHGLILIDMNKSVQRIVYLKLPDTNYKQLRWTPLFLSNDQSNKYAFRMKRIKDIAYNPKEGVLYVATDMMVDVYDLRNREMRGSLYLNECGEVIVSKDEGHKLIGRISAIHVGYNGYLYLMMYDRSLEVIIDGTIISRIRNIDIFDSCRFILEGDDRILILEGNKVFRVFFDEKKENKLITEVPTKVELSCIARDNKGDVQIGSTNAHYKLIDRWYIQRILWIGRVKNEYGGPCLLTLLPREMIREICQYI